MTPAVLLSVVELTIWIGLQLGMVYYQLIGLTQTRRALRVLKVGDGDAYRIGQEKRRAQRWRMSVILLNLVLGVLILIHVKDLMIPLGLVLLFGEYVLFRNQRADVLQVKRMAAEAIEQTAP